MELSQFVGKYRNNSRHLCKSEGYYEDNYLKTQPVLFVMGTETQHNGFRKPE